MKMFGNDLTYMTCNEMLGKLRELSLSVAGFTVKLLKVRKNLFKLAFISFQLRILTSILCILGSGG